MLIAHDYEQFQLAAMLLAPWEGDAGPDEIARRYWKLWLTRPTVEWPASPDWRWTADQAERVAEAKAEFQGCVPECGEPSADELTRAASAFRRLFALKSPADDSPDTWRAAEVLRAILREPQAAKWFISARFRLKNDWTGEPAIDLTLIAADDTPEREEFQREWTRFRRWLHAEWTRRGIADRYPYIGLSTAEGIRELFAGEIE